MRNNRWSFKGMSVFINTNKSTTSQYVVLIGVHRLRKKLLHVNTPHMAGLRARVRTRAPVGLAARGAQAYLPPLSSEG